MYEHINTRFLEPLQKPQKFKFFHGGSGSGKSVSIAQYFIQGLISGDGYNRAFMRKTFPSLKLTTYLLVKDIIEDWGLSSKIRENKTDHFFECGKNRLYYLSLDDSEKIKGMEMKEIWLEEATDFTEQDFKQLRIRLSRNRFSENVKMILSFNPIGDTHWLIKFLDVAKNRPDLYLLHHSTYHDNIINLSQSFIDDLEEFIHLDENFYRIYTLGLPGVIKGRIYTHISVEDSEKWPWANLNESLHCYGLDFGFNHPMALMEIWYYEDEFYVRELYYKKDQTTDDLAIWMERNSVSKTDYIFADSAEPDRIETLNTSRTIKKILPDTNEEINTYISRFNVQGAKKDVKAGIDYLKSKKIHLCSTSVNTIKEINNYKYKEDKNGNRFDEPVKAFDDACFIAGTLITTNKGKVLIENIKVGDKVLTRNGFKEVLNCGLTSMTARVKTLKFDNGKTLTGTPNHPIYVIGKGFIPLDTIRYGDYLLSELTELQMLRKSNLMESDSDDTLIQKEGNTELIIPPEEQTGLMVSKHYIKRSGNSIMEKSQKDIISTIKMEIPSTIPLKILNVFQERNILRNMQSRTKKILNSLNGKNNTLKTSDPLRKLGIHQKKGISGIQSMEKGVGNLEIPLKESVINAEKNMNLTPSVTILDFVQMPVNQHGEGQAEQMTKQEYVKNVGKNSELTNMKKPPVALKVVQLKDDGKKEPVYNLTVKDTHEYFANEVLVHNCDAMRYGIFTLNIVCNLDINQSGIVGYPSVSYEGQKDVWGAMGF